MTQTTKGWLIVGGMMVVGLVLLRFSYDTRIAPMEAPTPVAPQPTAQAEALHSLGLTDEQTKAAINSVAAQFTKARAKWLKTPAGKLCQKHKDWDDDACEAIVHKQVHIGMTEQQALLSWGTPHNVHSTTLSSGMHFQWCYGESCSSSLYFDNGVLTAIQN